MRRWIERKVIDEMAKVEEDLGEACLLGREFAVTREQIPIGYALSVAASRGRRSATATVSRPVNGHAILVAAGVGETPTEALYDLRIKLRAARP